jgi:hypothetical protein
MKKLIYIFIFTLGLNSYAQSFVEKYEDVDDVTSVFVTEEMFNMLGSIEPEGQNAKEEIEVLKDLTGLSIISTDSSVFKDKIMDDVKNYVTHKNMKELMRINDEDANVKFYVIKGDKPYIAKELVMIVIKKQTPEEIVVMDLTGKINLKKLSKLNSKVQMVDKKYFEEVEQKMNDNE